MPMHNLSADEERHDRTRRLLGATVHAHLTEMHVAVVGIGGVGSHAAVALARTGIGALTVIDDERVQSSDMNRQIWARMSTLGQKKTTVARAYLSDIAPSLRLVCHEARLTTETIDTLLSPEPDAVIDAIDSVRDKATLIGWCSARGIPIITSGGMANRCDPTALRVAHMTEITGCSLIRAVRKRLRKEGYPLDVPAVYSLEEPRHQSVLSPLPSWQPVPGAAGLIAAAYICQNLCEKTL